MQSSNFMVREGAYRAALNMPIQGTAADITKIAMIRVSEALRDQPDVSLLLQVHDSILIEAPTELADEVAKVIKEQMESIKDLPVKMTVDVNIGKNWGDI